MHDAILQTLKNIPDDQNEGVLVEVVGTRGSTPREVGAMMLVLPESISGTIGGGHLEYTATQEARAWLIAPKTSATAATFEREVVLSAALGQCCGGVVRLRYTLMSTKNRATLIARIQQTPWLQPIMLFGAGHVGEALVKALLPLPFRIVWLDNRADVFPATLQHDRLQTLECDCPEAEVAHAPQHCAFVVMTHAHDLDRNICEAIALRAKNEVIPYFGLIGSLSKRKQFMRHWQEKGLINQGDFSTLTCPIGIEGIAGDHRKTPAVIAVAVAAQLLQNLSLNPTPSV